MAEIFTTPCTKNGRSGFKFLRWILRSKKMPGQHKENNPFLAADKTPSQCESLYNQVRLARQTRLNIQNALVREQVNETCGFNFNNNIEKPISEVLEDISRNISKMDQNVYAARANMEDVLRANSNTPEFVSLD